MNADPVGRSDEQAPDPSEDELRAAYEAEMSRITSTDMILQAAVSLLNIGGYRLGLSASPDRPESEGDARDLEQVRDAIDGVRALLPILERSRPGELRPLRDALSQLQMAYAREAQGAATESGAQPPGATQGAPPAAGAPGAPAPGAGPAVPPAEGKPGAGPAESSGPGPAESSGRLWVPGR